MFVDDLPQQRIGKLVLMYLSQSSNNALFKLEKLREINFFHKFLLHRWKLSLLAVRRFLVVDS